MGTKKLLQTVFVSGFLVSAVATVWAADSENEYDRFLKQVVNEARVIEQARAAVAELVTKDTFSTTEMLLAEERIRQQAEQTRRRALEREAQEKEPPTPEADLIAAARELIAKERQRIEGLRAERAGRLMESAREHLRLQRFDAAARVLETLLREDPVNRDAAALLERVTVDRRESDAGKVELAKNRETNASRLYVDQIRIPYAATQTYPDDWAEQSARARSVIVFEQTEEETANAAVRAALEQKTSINATETPLVDIAAYLRHVSGVNIILEKDAGEQTVDLMLADVSVRSVLDWATRLTDLSYAINDGSVYIGTAGRVAAKPVVRIYDVSDLLHVRQVLERGRNRKPGGFGKQEEEFIDPFEEVATTATLAELGEDLMEFLKEVTGQDNWADPREATMDIRFGRLVVNAEPGLQEKILEIIEKVRE